MKGADIASAHDAGTKFEAQYAEVLGDRRTGDVAEVRGDVGRRELLGPDQAQDLAALGIGDGFEGDVHVRQCKRSLT